MKCKNMTDRGIRWATLSKLANSKYYLFCKSKNKDCINQDFGKISYCPHIRSGAKYSLQEVSNMTLAFSTKENALQAVMEFCWQHGRTLSGVLRKANDIGISLNTLENIIYER